MSDKHQGGGDHEPIWIDMNRQTWMLEAGWQKVPRNISKLHGTSIRAVLQSLQHYHVISRRDTSWYVVIRRETSWHHIVTKCGSRRVIDCWVWPRWPQIGCQIGCQIGWSSGDPQQAMHLIVASWRSPSGPSWRHRGESRIQYDDSNSMKITNITIQYDTIFRSYHIIIHCRIVIYQTWLWYLEIYYNSVIYFIILSLNHNITITS